MNIDFSTIGKFRIEVYENIIIVNDFPCHEIYRKFRDGYEEWKEYNSDGKLIHFKTSNGLEEWWEYNDSGRKKYYHNSYGTEKYFTDCVMG